MNAFTQPHRRFNPLTREWILVSPQRNQRPWLGQVEASVPETRPIYDPACYLCPGNARAGDQRNSPYDDVFVFDNDFPALVPDPPAEPIAAPGLLRAESERGICRVICFSPRHDLTLARMTLASLRRVVEVWTDQMRELSALDFVNYIQIFENKGALMGASNPHPHGQVWTSQHIPTEPAKELRAQEDYLREHHTCLLCDYLAAELSTGERIIQHNEHFVALVPFWAEWPFETMVLARRHLGSLLDLSAAERDALADLLKRLNTRYDNLFQSSFPYSMGLHQNPTDGKAYPALHWHAHYYPPLLRNATIRKFMVGYEMLANPQRDLTPETAATRLREMSDARFND